MFRSHVPAPLSERDGAPYRRRATRTLAVGIEPLEGRRLLSGGAARAAVVAHHAQMSVMWGPATTGPRPHAPRLVPGARFREPIEIDSQNGLLRATLTAEETRVTIGGRRFLARVYNGSFVGPTLRVRPGDHVELTLVNHLSEPTNLHFHGLHISPSGSADNVFLSVAPGRSFVYSFDVPLDQPTGLYWYHSHADVLSEEQVFGGMSGLISVEGLKDDLPPALQGIQERLFALKDLQVAGNSIIRNDIDSNAPTTRTVNGQFDPTLTIRPGETQLWRFANIGADIFYSVHLDHHRFLVIAEDGNPVSTPYFSNDLILPPGKRFEVLVQGGQPGVSLLRTLAYRTGADADSYPTRTLATLVTRGRPEPKAALPAFIAPFDDLRDEPIAQRRVFQFSQAEDDMHFFINGRQFDPNRIVAQPQVGTVEEWEIDNGTDEQHPFHLHTNPFQVVSINGAPYDAHGYQDTVILPPGGSVVIRVAFQDFTGKTLFHCHILAHADHGMMAAINMVE